MQVVVEIAGVQRSHNERRGLAESNEPDDVRMDPQGSVYHISKLKTKGEEKDREKQTALPHGSNFLLE